MAVQQQEPVLLVGETGTGKTTAVQQLASQVRASILCNLVWLQNMLLLHGRLQVAVAQVRLWHCFMHSCAHCKAGQAVRKTESDSTVMFQTRLQLSEPVPATILLHAVCQASIATAAAACMPVLIASGSGLGVVQTLYQARNLLSHSLPFYRHQLLRVECVLSA